MKNIFSLLTDYKLPLWAMLLLVLVIIILSSPVIVKLIDVSAGKKKIKGNTYSREDLLNHSFFDFINYCLNVRIKQLDFDDDFKNNVFRDMLLIQYQIFRDNMKQFITEYTESQLSPSVFKGKVAYLLYDTLEDCEKEYRKLDIPEIDYVFEQFRGWKSIAIDFMQKYSYRIMKSDIYDNDTERLNAILDLYTTALEINLLDVEAGLQKINGRFKGMKYKSKLV